MGKKIVGGLLASGIALATMAGTANARPEGLRGDIATQVAFCESRGGTVERNAQGEPRSCNLPNGDSFHFRYG